MVHKQKSSIKSLHSRGNKKGPKKYYWLNTANLAFYKQKHNYSLKIAETHRPVTSSVKSIQNAIYKSHEILTPLGE